MQDVAAEMLREARAQLAEQTIAHNLRVLGDVCCATIYPPGTLARDAISECCNCEWPDAAHLADRRVR